MNTPDEFKNKYLISAGFIVFIVVLAFTAGMIIQKVSNTDDNTVKAIEDLRTEMNKEDNLIRDEVVRVEEKIGRKIKNHELAKHK